MKYISNSTVKHTIVLQSTEALHRTKFKLRFLDYAKRSMTIYAQGHIIMEFQEATPVILSSLIQDLSLQSLEKLHSALPVLTGKVKKRVN